MDETEPHAVRWATRLYHSRPEPDYSKWHWTTNGRWTACGCTIPIGQFVSFLPGTDERSERVDCTHCRMVAAQET